MKTKLMVIGILSMFLLTGIASLTVIGTKESLLEQSLYNKNNVDDEYEGDLIVLEPQVPPCYPYGGLYKIRVSIKNNGLNTAHAPFYDSIIWAVGTEDEQLLSDPYKHENDIESIDVDEYWITFKAPSKGYHTITILTDCHLEDENLNDLVFEEDETNNYFTKSYHFWWSRSCTVKVLVVKSWLLNYGLFFRQFVINLETYFKYSLSDDKM